MLLNDSKTDIGYSLCIQPSASNTKDIQTNQSYEFFLLPNWNKFRSLKEFTSCITKSDQVSYSYFIVSCSSLIQSLPKYQYFIKDKVIDLPPHSLAQNLFSAYPITSPLQLLCQPSFWDDLISVYFQSYHTMCPLFSIQSFDKNTASQSLLSAMHYCGYQFSKNRPREVSEYMEKLAIQNIKKSTKSATLDNMRALVIHTFMAQWGGKLFLAKNLQAQLSRMSYLLGLHLNCKKISAIDRYNRGILFSFVRAANVRLSGSQNFSPHYLTEFGYDEPSIYEPRWQHPIPGSYIYFDNEAENQLYSLLYANSFKFGETSGRKTWFPSFTRMKNSDFNILWSSNLNSINTEFDLAIKALEDLKLEYSQFKHKVEVSEIHVRMFYHETMINMYEILKHKNKSYQSKDIENILDHCHKLYQVFLAGKMYSPVLMFFVHVVGLHYINIYPKCTEEQKQTTKQRLKDLILYMKDKFMSDFSLNYLILKTGFDSLDDS